MLFFTNWWASKESKTCEVAFPLVSPTTGSSLPPTSLGWDGAGSTGKQLPQWGLPFRLPTGLMQSLALNHGTPVLQEQDEGGGRLLSRSHNNATWVQRLSYLHMNTQVFIKGRNPASWMALHLKILLRSCLHGSILRKASMCDFWGVTADAGGALLPLPHSRSPNKPPLSSKLLLLLGATTKL